MKRTHSIHFIKIKGGAKTRETKKKESAIALERARRDIPGRAKPVLAYSAFKQLLEKNPKKLAKEYYLDSRLRPVFFDLLDKHRELIPLVDKFFEKFPELAGLPVRWLKK